MSTSESPSSFLNSLLQNFPATDAAHEIDSGGLRGVDDAHGVGGFG